MRISDWSSDVCSSDLSGRFRRGADAEGSEAGERSGGFGRGERADGECGGVALSNARQSGRGWAGFFADDRDFGGEVRLRLPVALRRGRIQEIGRATSELQSLMRISYAVFCLKKKNVIIKNNS